jgi:formylglycine-generating enzyme required for sulfatase activity
MKKTAIFLVYVWVIGSNISANQNENMVLINGGTFTMGSPAKEAGRNKNETQHQVTVSSFYMCKFVVSQKEYQEVTGTNPGRYKGDNLPVEWVSWYDAIEYCNKLSEKEGLTPAYIIEKNQIDPNNKCREDTQKWTVTWNRNANGYRLPTEAEWEYACRAGTATPFNTGDNITTFQANYDGERPYNGNETGIFMKRIMSIASFQPNTWGLYNMHGNVWEWCWDWFDAYPGGKQTDPTGPVSGAYRIVRGGSWFHAGKTLRSACRYSDISSFRYLTVGFRVVRSGE